MSDDNSDFAPIEPMPAVAQPQQVPAAAAADVPPADAAGPAAPVAPAAATPSAMQVAPPLPPQNAAPQPVPTAPPVAPPGYYVPPAPPQAPYPGQPYPGQAYPGQYAYAPAPPQGLSVTSMILGIASIVTSGFYGFGLLVGVAAVITGHLGRKRQPNARGFSLAGLITGYIGIAFSLIVIAIFVVVIVLAVNGQIASSTDGSFGDN